MAAPIPFDAPVTTATLPASFLVLVFIMWCCCVCGLTTQPGDVRPAKKDEAVLKAAIRTIRTSGNRHWAQPVLGVPCARLRVSVAEVERKSGLRRTWWLARCPFSCQKHQRSSDGGYCAYAGFSATTREVIRNPSFEIEGG